MLIECTSPMTSCFVIILCNIAYLQLGSEIIEEYYAQQANPMINPHDNFSGGEGDIDEDNCVLEDPKHLEVLDTEVASPDKPVDGSGPIMTIFHDENEQSTSQGNYFESLLPFEEKTSTHE